VNPPQGGDVTRKPPFFPQRIRNGLTYYNLVLAMKVLAAAFISMLLLSAVAVAQFAKKASVETIIVPDDYATIQEAINAATTGDTIFVANGTYYEHVVLNKTVALVGENQQNTIILYGVIVSSNGVNMTGFCIEGSYGSIGLNILANDTTVYENTIANNGFGILIGTGGQTDVRSYGNNIYKNNITNNDEGTVINDKYNNITENTFTNNNVAVDLWSSASYNRIAGNTVSGGSGVILEGSSNNLVIGNSISTPVNTTIWAINLMLQSSYNNVTGNNLTGSQIIIQISSGAENNYIAENKITGTVNTTAMGIVLFGVSNNQIYKNNLTNCTEGINLNYFPWNIIISTNNTVSENRVVANRRGIVFGNSVNTINNTVTGNNITSNSDCGMLNVSSNNGIYHNNFVDNAQQVDGVAGANSWDNGYPSGGNYWDDYIGTDANGDGIGDISYAINENNTDRYPLMFPFGTSPPPTPTPSPSPSPSPSPTPTPTPVPTASPSTEPTPSPEIPEVPSPLITSILFAATISAGLIYKIKRKQKY
jgi:parallel beta-helix repeat protein